MNATGGRKLASPLPPGVRLKWETRGRHLFTCSKNGTREF